MIHVKRNGVPAPSVLVGKSSGAAREFHAAKAFFSVAENHAKGFRFKVYRDYNVKHALELLFHGKCAYCESTYFSVHPMDVEHYRPKGGYVVGGKLKKPGYWWLASDWDNLLPSCIDCNRARTHRFPNDEEEIHGKGNLFPLEDETARARAPGQEQRESPLLLHPCRDRPERLLEYIDGGVVRPRKRLRWRNRKIADTTIRVLGLNRSGLNRERAELQKRILYQLHVVERSVAVFREDSEDSRARRELLEDLRELKKFCSERRPYSGMARQMIDGFLRTVCDEFKGRIDEQLEISKAK